MAKKFQQIETALAHYQQWSTLRQKLERYRPDASFDLHVSCGDGTRPFATAPVDHTAALGFATEQLSHYATTLAELGVDVNE